jgi:hypothetical protein
VIYDYNIELAWKLELMEKHMNEGEPTKVVSKCEGTYFFPEVSNDEEEDGWACQISFSKDPDNLQGIFN